jgi:hypothetical protein
MKACWQPRNVIARVQRAEHRSPHTWPASRHARMIGVQLQSRQGREALADTIERYAEDASAIGVSILATVELLYKAHIEIKRLRDELDAQTTAAAGNEK